MFLLRQVSKKKININNFIFFYLNSSINYFFFKPSYSVREGQCIFIKGINGSGKSSIFSCKQLPFFSLYKKSNFNFFIFTSILLIKSFFNIFSLFLFKYLILNTFLSILSTGNKKAFIFIIENYLNLNILFLDELFTNLDLNTIMFIKKELKSSFMCTKRYIFISHNTLFNNTSVLNYLN